MVAVCGWAGGGGGGDGGFVFFYFNDTEMFWTCHNGCYFAEQSLNVFSSKKIFQLRLKFPLSLFLRVQLTICHYWLR